MIIVCHNVTSDDAVELRFEDETVVEFTDNSNKVHLYSLLPSEMDNYDDNDFEDDEYDE